MKGLDFETKFLFSLCKTWMTMFEISVRKLLVVLSYFLLFLNWLVIATSIYLLSLMSHALLWGFAVGMMVMVGFYALGQAFSPPVRQG